MSQNQIVSAFATIGPNFSLVPFAEILQPLVHETLAEHGKAKWRKGTILLPAVTVWLVLALTLRRELNCEQVLNWMVSGFRWLSDLLPAKANLVAGGTISHARVKLGFELFERLFSKLRGSLPALEADFYGRITCIFDGSTGTMPDSSCNVAAFGQTQNQTGAGAFPQLRMMALLVLRLRVVLDVAYAPYCGKGNGERALMMQLLKRTAAGGLLYLMDAGLYAFELVWQIHQVQKQDFLAKISSTVKLKFSKQLPDGSYLATITQKAIDTGAPPRADGRNRLQILTMTVRVICVQIPGFRPCRLVTSILAEDCTAYALAVHYHTRWDIEISYDEIKTHQCATRRGQSPTLFRSMRPDLVKQELYAIMITYNLVRLTMAHAATEHNKAPCVISFLDSLHHLLAALPLLTFTQHCHGSCPLTDLYQLLADCELAYPRRPRTSPRVVKVKSSKFPRKTQTHLTQTRHFDNEIKIFPHTSDQHDLFPLASATLR